MLGGTLVALMVLAAGFPQLQLRPGEPFPYTLFTEGGAHGQANVPTPNLPTSFIALLWLGATVLVILILGLWIITFIFKPEARKRMLRRIIVYSLLLFLLFNLFGVLQGLKLSNNETGEANGQPQNEVVKPQEAVPTPPAFIVAPPRWLVATVAFVLIALILLGVWFYLHRRRIKGQIKETPLDLLVQEVQHALDHLQEGGDFKNNVLGCYEAMLRILGEERNIQRERAMTARDFEQHLLTLGFSDDHIHHLTRLFERVRYGFKPPTPSEEAEAVDCLTAIVQAYGRAL
jgi:hypothetical protein